VYLCRGFIRKQCWVHQNFTPLRRVVTFFAATHTRARLSYHSPQLTHRQSWLPGKKARKKSPGRRNDLLNYRDLPHCHRTQALKHNDKSVQKEKNHSGLRARAKRRRCPGAACSADLSPPLCSDQRLFVKINFISRELPRGFRWVGREGVDFASGANKF
jgi:hypothetical protein